LIRLCEFLFLCGNAIFKETGERCIFPLPARDPAMATIPFVISTQIKASGEARLLLCRAPAKEIDHFLAWITYAGWLGISQVDLREGYYHRYFLTFQNCTILVEHLNVDGDQHMILFRYSATHPKVQRPRI